MALLNFKLKEHSLHNLQELPIKTSCMKTIKASMPSVECVQGPVIALCEKYGHPQVRLIFLEQFSNP